MAKELHHHDDQAQESAINPHLLNSLEWRLIGPFRAGRVVATAGDPANPLVFYFGSTGGGIWKTTDGGLLWENVSDGFFKRASVGALAVASSDPNVLYVGMGETTIRGNVSHGDGMYKSTDGGKTWQHLGLENTRHIAKVCIHPQNPDLVYIAAFGHAHGPNPERGVYRSHNGGATWEQVLFRSDKAGAIDLAMDPNNPRILYASFWEARREPHTLISGGEDSGIFKSTDGGETWSEITRHQGLPTGLLGKIGLAISPAKAGRVWAVVEAEDGAVFRSDDWGETWQRLSEERPLRARAWYYQHIIADTHDADTLWVLNVQAWKSIDGGRTFSEVSVTHADTHALWIDPKNPQRMIIGHDGGACVSFNGGESWSTPYNQPTTEFYHVTTDNQVPYRVYGAQQDNTTLCLPNRASWPGITQSDWYDIGGGESGYIAVRPDNSNIVYAGNYQGFITRYDHRTRQSRNISVWPELASGSGAKDQKYRFQWTCPIVLSPHDPNELYITGNYVFRSTDEGQSWEIISPDLTRNDVTKQESSGGPITKDNTGAEYYCTIFAFAESPVKRGVFWAGSDDGLIHLSQDGGKNWHNVTPPALPEWSLVSIIEPSPHDPATAYIATTCYKMDNFQPYLFKTNDYGKTWTKIVTGIPTNDFTRVIREDPTRRGLLFAGTETGIYVSFDDGSHWQSLRGNLPVVPIHDLVIKGSDLIVATHGRAFWVLDDITPLRQISEQLQDHAAFLFSPRPTIRFITNTGFSRGPAAGGKYFRTSGTIMITARRSQKPTGETVDRNLDAGQNPPDGVIVSYYLKDKPEGEVKLTFLDAQGNEIKTFSSEEKPDTGKNNAAKATEKKEIRILKEAGTNRFVWDMRYPEATKVEGFMGMDGPIAAPVAAPGHYQVRLTLGDQEYTQPFELQKDPRIAATEEDLQAQFELRIRIRDKVSQTHEAINLLRDIRQQVEDWERRSQAYKEREAIASSASILKEKLAQIEEELIQVKAKTRQDTLNHPAKLNAKIVTLANTVGSADAAPTNQVRELFEDLSARINAQLKLLQEVIETELAAFNAQLRASDVPPVIAITALSQ